MPVSSFCAPLAQWLLTKLNSTCKRGVHSCSPRIFRREHTSERFRQSQLAQVSVAKVLVFIVIYGVLCG